jgi:hypothetical protein
MITFLTMTDISFLRAEREEKIAFIQKNHPYYTWVNFVGYTDAEIEEIRLRTELILHQRSSSNARLSSQ